MHPSLKELAVKVAKAKKKEHKLKFSLNGAWPESLCNSLEPQIKQQQEQAQKLETSILFFENTLKCLLKLILCFVVREIAISPLQYAVCSSHSSLAERASCQGG